ncbi:MAG: acyl-CoA dehydrogenase family protein, partial [Dehalococcoidia bacterium]
MLEPTTQENLIRDFVKQVAKKYGRDYWLAKAREGAFAKELWDELASGGYLGMLIPEEYGGGGLGMREMAVLQEELSHQGTPLLLIIVSAVMDATLITRYGNEAMKKRYLPGMARGEIKICFALTEPTAGSNSFRISTKAVRDGDSYVLNGQKTFISAVDQSDYILV